MARIDTILFDLDGTLVDTAGDLAASLNHALVVLGRPPVPPESVRGMVGQGARRLLERGLAATGLLTAELVEAGVQPFLAHYADHIAVESRPFPGAPAALDQLAAEGYALGICTNKPVALAQALIEALGWSSRFGAILGADSRPWRKPDPRHLTDTLAACGGHRAVFVGDSETDQQTADAAGVPFVLVGFGYPNGPLDAIPAAAFIEHFDELPGAVRAIQSRFIGQAPDRQS